jgi:hypothetical protein
VQVVIGKGAQFEFYLPRACPFANGRAGVESDNANARSGLEQASDLRFADLAGPNNQALSPSQFHEHRK